MPATRKPGLHLVRRSGVTQTLARETMRTHPTLIAAMLLRRGAVDAMLCGTSTFSAHLNHVLKVIGACVRLAP